MGIEVYLFFPCHGFEKGIFFRASVRLRIGFLEISGTLIAKKYLKLENNKCHAIGNRTMYTNPLETKTETFENGFAEKPRPLGHPFSEILERSMKPWMIDSAEVVPKKASEGNNGVKGMNRVPLGTLSEKNPSVSNLLIKHPVYGRNCWKIIHARINQNKPFTKIGKGTPVYVDPKNLEITWNSQAKTVSQTPPAGTNDPAGAEKAPRIFLGSLSKGRPTVSHLLINNPKYGKECWDILSHGLNRSKAFTEIPVGTPVYLNADTREITWDGQMAASNVKKPPEPSPAEAYENKQVSKSDPFSEKLVGAVKPYIGTSYRKMDCFELLVNGLEKMGIQYRGPGGLGNNLIKMAVENGLPENHYLSGEGLIETSGSLVYTKSIPAIRSSQTEAMALYKEIEPLLGEGLILSFSTPSRGHTGIVSKKANHWTYINSGNMDHLIAGRRKKGVGEESLAPEIRNWFRLAAGNGEALSITMGKLNERKLRQNLGLQTSAKGRET